ncbi:MAG: phosphatidate cytidylyltransferase [Candidatus Firestonebacteria bacterium]|nr:phosphatidate cytidylyltransferase [Candidatus Firestonebacteria bacterium]
MIGRIIIAFLFIPLLVLLVLLDNPMLYNILITLGLFIGLLEYSSMMKKGGVKIFTVINALFFAAVLVGLAKFRVSAVNVEFLYRTFTLIIVYAVAVTIFSLVNKDIKESVLRIVFSIFGVFYIVILGSSLFFVRSIGPYQTLFLFAVVWIYDSGAYFVGSKFGRNKITPIISPKKSLEGLIGGIIIALLVITLFKYFKYTEAFVPYNNLSHIYTIVIILCLAAQAGDLLESLLKRYCGVKDSSNLLLEHGGILDKLDSFLVATPVYLLLAVM